MNNKVQLDYQTIKTPNGQVGYVKIGSGKPLIMLVGYSGNLLHWNSELIFSLAEEFCVYLPDNRKVGCSYSNNPESMTGLAMDIADFIIALELEQPIICGWSMGGIIAQSLAINYSELISGLCFIVSQPDYSYTYGNLHQLVTNLREQPSRENREKLTGLFFSELPSIEFRKYLARTILPIKHYVHPFNAEAQQLQNHCVNTWRSDEEQIKLITTRSLITVAKNDLVTRPEASHLLHSLLPNSKLISYSDGGHFFLHHYPFELAQQIKLFFGVVEAS